MIKWILLTTSLVLLSTSLVFGKEQQTDLECLAEAIYYEARGETFISQLAVGTVIINRVYLDNYPNTVCNVIHQGFTKGKKSCQFSYYCDGKPELLKDSKAKEESFNVARLILDGAMVDGIGEATHYHAFYVTPYWSESFMFLRRVGSHLFYREM